MTGLYHMRHIMAELKISNTAIRNRVKKLGLETPLTKDELEQVKNWDKRKKNEFSLRNVARMLRISHQGVEDIRKRLKIELPLDETKVKKIADYLKLKIR
jgi:hypothetical protein